MNSNRDIEKLKESFHNIPIPQELDFTIEKAIQAGKKEKKKNNLYKLMASAALLCFAILTTHSAIKTNETPFKSTVYTEPNNSITEKTLPMVETVDNLKVLLSKFNNETPNFRDISEAAEINLNTTTKKDAAGSFSQTNVQVAGVDEGDTIKTDGDYIYKIKNKINNNSSQGVQIIKALPSENMTIVQSINTDNITPVQLYVKDNYLIVIGSISKPIKIQSLPEMNQKNTVKADMIYPYYSSTSVQVYDISDKTNAKLLRKVELDGNYSASRLIGSNLYFISNKYIYKDMLEDSTTPSNFLPSYKDSLEGNNSQTLDLNKVTYCPEALDSSYIMIGSLNLNKLNEKLNITATLGSGRNIYCSLDNLYIAGYNYTPSKDFKTTIYKFKLSDGIVNFQGSGEVKGNILNQFSMDESNGNLRITTTNTLFDGNNNNQDNNLFILDKDMKVIGKIEGLAKGERIYSTRFIGDKAFMVTFKNTDPLFVLDLKNPENPKVLGELKIPGFSTYLHPYDENHIIGFGKDTEIRNNGNGEVAYQKGMKLALFDVSDLSNPKQEFMTTIGDSGTYSNLLSDHKALLFSKEKNLLAFPITVMEQTTDKNTSAGTSKGIFTGAYVYNIDLKTGFNLKGKLTHINNNDIDAYNYNWNSTISRVIYIKDNIYTISNSSIKANNIADLKEKGNLELK
jgi:uncharacterized secreted protein with C-terminal beta-propeller domain